MEKKLELKKEVIEDLSSEDLSQIQGCANGFHITDIYHSRLRCLKLKDENDNALAASADCIDK